ncbi:MAG: thioredoxin family protein [Spirochaetota bacterium]
MRFKLTTTGVMILLLMAFSSCSAKENDKAEKKAPADKADHVVTFVELGSANCIPCKMMKPVMKKVEEQYGDQVKVVFHDVGTSEGRPYARSYSIRVIPTQVFLDKDGKEYFRHEGFFPFEEVEKVLKKQGVR